MENKEILEKMKYFPMLVGRSSLGKDLSNDEYNDFWKVFYALSEETKDVLVAPEMSQRIEQLQKERGLSDDLIEIISAIIREYFVYKKDSLWLENALLAKLERKDVSFAKDFIQKNILTIQPAPKTFEEDASIPSVKTLELPLLEAMSKYQRLSEQTLTEDRIMVKGEPMPVRGSLRNWVRHYRDVLGIRKHSALERGQMLFQGENTKRLGGAERERLALVFRSLDENIPLSIDSGRQEIIFPAFEEKASVLASPASSEGSEKSLPSIGTSFRPVEKFPARTAPIKKALEWNGSQRAPEPSRSPESSGLSVPVYGGASTPPLGLGSPLPAASGLESQAAAPSPFSLGGKMSFSSQHKLPSEQERANQGGASDMHQVPQANPVSQASQRVGIIRPRGNRFEPRDVSSGISPSRDSGGSDSSPVVNLRGRQQ